MNFTKWQIASLRSSAKSYYTLLNKKKKLEEKKEAALLKLNQEIEAIKASMDVVEAPVKTFFNNYGIEDLIVKVGKEPEAKYVLLHPETIIPEEVSVTNEESESEKEEMTFAEELAASEGDMANIYNTNNTTESNPF